MLSLNEFAMDTATLAGPLEAKLAAMRDAGFAQVVLNAGEVVGHPQGVDAAVEIVRQSGLRVTAFQALRDFEGLPGQLHAYKADVAKAMLRTCAALDCRVMLACSSTSQHASQDFDEIARDLGKLAMLALPLGVRIAYEALSWGRTIREFTTAWDIVCRADCPNLGLSLNSFHAFAAQTPVEEIDEIDPERIFLVQLSDFMWTETAPLADRLATARTFRVFPGEGVHSEPLAELVLRLDRLGYRGDFSFEVSNEDYLQLPATVVAARARRSALWLSEDVLHEARPLPAWASRRT